MNTSIYLIFQNSNLLTDIGYITPKMHAALLSETTRKVLMDLQVFKVVEKACMICSSSSFKKWER